MVKKLLAAALAAIMASALAGCEDSSSEYVIKKATTTTFTFTYVAQNTSREESSSTSDTAETTTTKSTTQSSSETTKNTTASATTTTSKTSEQPTQTQASSTDNTTTTTTTKRITQATTKPAVTSKATTKATMNIVNIDQKKLLEAYKALIAGTSTDSQRELIRLDLVQYTYQKYTPSYNTGLYVFTDASGKPTADENKRVKDGNCGFNFGCSHEYETTDYYRNKTSLDDAAKKYMKAMKAHIDSDAQYINSKSNRPFSQQGFNVVLYKSKYEAMLYYDTNHKNIPLYVMVLCYTG